MLQQLVANGLGDRGMIRTHQTTLRCDNQHGQLALTLASLVQSMPILVMMKHAIRSVGLLTDTLVDIRSLIYVILE